MGFYEWDPPIAVVYDYDKDGASNNTQLTWEFCDSSYEIVLTAVKLFDSYEECCQDMDEALRAAKKGKVCKATEADKLKTKQRIEVYPHEGDFRFRLVDQNGVVRAISVRNYTFERAWSVAQDIIQYVGKARFHYLNYGWHEDHPRVDLVREEFLKAV